MVLFQFYPVCNLVILSWNLHMSWKGTRNENGIAQVELGKLALAKNTNMKTLKPKHKSKNW